AEINSFLASAGISDLETEKKLTITVISDLERQSSQLAIDQQAAKGRLDEAEKKFAATREWPQGPELRPNESSGASTLDARFIELMARRDDLLTKFRPGAREFD